MKQVVDHQIYKKNYEKQSTKDEEPSNIDHDWAGASWKQQKADSTIKVCADRCNDKAFNELEESIWQ